MKLSDIMGSMDLASYAEAGLIVFVLAFVAIALDLIRRSKQEMDDAARIPFSDEVVSPKDEFLPSGDTKNSRHP